MNINIVDLIVVLMMLMLHSVFNRF